MSKTRWTMLVVVTVFPALLLGGGFAYAAGWRPVGTEPEAGPAASVRAAPQQYGSAPSYTLNDQTGHAFSSRSLRGKVRVVGFMFPYCTTDCPVVARQLAVLQHKLATQGLGDQAAIVTFNVDPKNAGRQQLRAFLDQYRATANPAKASVDWRFLTGSPKQVRHVVTGGWHVSYYRVHGEEEAAEHPNPLAERADVSYDVKHTEVIYIVGRYGKILRGIHMRSITEQRLEHAVHNAFSSAKGGS